MGSCTSLSISPNTLQILLDHFMDQLMMLDSMGHWGSAQVFWSVRESPKTVSKEILIWRSEVCHRMNKYTIQCQSGIQFFRYQPDPCYTLSPFLSLSSLHWNWAVLCGSLKFLRTAGSSVAKKEAVYNS